MLEYEVSVTQINAQMSSQHAHGKTRGKSHNLQLGKFRVDIRNCFFVRSTAQYWIQYLEWLCKISIPFTKVLKDSARQSPQLT